MSTPIHHTPSKKDLQRFWSNIDTTGGMFECWLWTASTAAEGYGYIWWGSRREYTHRISYTIHHGPIPEGLHILHRCDNPRCVNPTHLWAGSHKQNMHDKMHKGRSGTAKVTREIALEIRKQYASRKYDQKALAKRFGISQPTVSDIVNYVTWRET